MNEKEREALASKVAGEVADCMEKAVDSRGALEAQAALKGAADAIAAASTELLEDCNKEFQELQRRFPENKQFVVGSGVYTAYTKPRTYEFPPSVKELERELKEAKETSKRTGTAIGSDPAFDPKKDKCFKVAPLEKRL